MGISYHSPSQSCQAMRLGCAVRDTHILSIINVLSNCSQTSISSVTAFTACYD